MLIKLKYFIIYKYLKVVYFLGYIFIILCFKLKVILQRINNLYYLEKLVFVFSDK